MTESDLNPLGLPDKKPKQELLTKQTEGEAFTNPETPRTPETELEQPDDQDQLSSPEVNLPEIAVAHTTELKLASSLQAAEQSLADIDKIRTELEILRDPTATTEGLQNKLNSIHEQRKALERKWLETPEGDYSTLPEQQTVEKHQDAEEYMRTVEGIKLELETEREKSVDAFIKSTIEENTQWMDTYFAETKNLDKAKELATKKIEVSVKHYAEDFIRDGGKPNFGYTIEISSTYFTNQSGEKVLYITDIEVARWDSSESTNNQPPAEDKTDTIIDED